MAEEPDRLRSDIEATRATLVRDADRLADRTNPARIARRRWTLVKEKVMGTTEQARHVAGDTATSAGEKAREAADTVREAPQALATQTQGNPIAAGIIAFGVGLLTASLIPVTDAERRAGQELKDRSGDLTDRAKDIAGDVGGQVSGSVQEAMGEVRETARDAARTTGQDAKEQFRQAAPNS